MRSWITRGQHISFGLEVPGTAAAEALRDSQVQVNAFPGLLRTHLLPRLNASEQEGCSQAGRDLSVNFHYCGSVLASSTQRQQAYL